MSLYVWLIDARWASKMGESLVWQPAILANKFSLSDRFNNLGSFQVNQTTFSVIDDYQVNCEVVYQLIILSTKGASEPHAKTPEKIERKFEK